ncbi:MAG: hypothetical protein HYZ49_06910 [Chloroflexi bacterium]|nr:hypothetical protein [Chloroflexota bacterium]
MAVYRERKRIHPALLIGLAAVSIAVLILAVALIFFRPAPADPMIEARMKASEAAQGLEVFTIEYPQAAQGAELAGALGALARAQAAFESAQDELAKIDAAAAEQIAADFAALKAKAGAHAPAEEVLPLAEALREKLLALAGG